MQIHKFQRRILCFILYTGLMLLGACATSHSVAQTTPSYVVKSIKENNDWYEIIVIKDGMTRKIISKKTVEHLDRDTIQVGKEYQMDLVDLREGKVLGTSVPRNHRIGGQEVSHGTVIEWTDVDVRTLFETKQLQGLYYIPY